MRTITTLVFVLTGLFSLTFAADDPGIKGKMRTDIQEAMVHHIRQNTLNSKYIIYDAIEGKLHRLTLEKLHKGIVKKSEFYVSCADFSDHEGNKYDIDFLVAKKKETYEVLQALVHSANGKKRKYHLENN